MGSSDDFATAIDRVASLPYRAVALVGFSLGGNIVLKYLGEPLRQKPASLCAGVAVSAPCDLVSSARRMDGPENRMYTKRYLRLLRGMLTAKKRLFPGVINLDGFESIRTFKEFDDRYTAPLHGFKSAEDYWERSSSKPLLPAITVPTLMISACDDPILTPPCFPRDIARNHPHLTLEAPAFGGHVGFLGNSEKGIYWHERRTISFLRKNS
jgi:predicted alpha/beta-fold hydrolase